jgi:hypothetical protein
MELRLYGPASPRGLVLERAEGSEVALRLDHLQDPLGTERADELVLQVGVTDEDAELLEACSVERSPKVAFLARVAKSCDPGATVLGEEAPDRLRAAHRDHGNAIGGEVAAVALGERFDRHLVADALDEDYGSAQGTFT